MAIMPALTVVACNRHSRKNPVAAASEALKDKDLQKTFQSKCEIKGLDAVVTGIMSAGQASVKSSRVLWKFSGNQVTRTTVLFAQADCAQESWVFQETGKFKIDDKARTNDNGRHLDLDMDRLTLIVRDENGAKAANGIKLCNKADWSANSKEQNVTSSSKDVSCYNAQVPRKQFTAYRIDNGVLYMGDAADAPSARPASLNWANRYEAK